MILLLLALPILGAALVLVIPERAARWFAVGVAAATLVVAGGLLATRTTGRWQEVDVAWVPSLNLRFHLAVDGISWPLVTLTALLVLLCTLYTLRHVPSPGRVRPLLALLLALSFGVLGTFVAFDLLLFFVFFEVTLAPMFALIAVWGGPGRRHAARKFLLYTLFGSVLLLVGLVLIVVNSGTGEFGGGRPLTHGVQVAAFVLLALAFAVKSPLWPFHTWLPDAHTEAPTVGSVLLAGVLLKMGTYGLIRIALPVLPYGAERLAPVLGVLAVAAILVGSFVCLAQTDLKRLIAYSSVGHMGFVLLGIASRTEAGLQAALIGNIAHGVLTGLLFFLAGAVKERYGTGTLDRLGGLGDASPRLAGVLGLAAVGSLGIPGLAGFWGEGFAIVGAWQAGTLFRVLAVLAALGAALTAAYFLRMLRAVVTGSFSGTLPGLDRAEWAAFAPLGVLALALGLWPSLVLGLTSAPVEAIMKAVAP